MTADPTLTARPYRPSCGAEGWDFIDAWCGKCRRDRAFRDDEGDSCRIVAATMALDVDDPEYPREWVIDSAGPRCTAFEPDGPDDGVIGDARQEAMAL